MTTINIFLQYLTLAWINTLSDMGLLSHPVMDDLAERIVVFVQSLP